MPKLILIGGNEFQKPDGIDEYIANESNGVVDLLPYAGKDAGALHTLMANERYEPLETSIRPHGSGELLNPPATPARLTYISGGDQDKLRLTLGGSTLWKHLRAGVLAGEVKLAGSSAGAMVLFEQMITYASERSPNAELSQGLGLIKGNILLVPHWNVLSGEWQTNFIDTYSDFYIIGVDENTAIIWEYGEARVIGLGKVIIYDQLVRNEYKTGDSFRLEFKFS